MHLAQIKKHAEQAGKMGIHFQSPKIDFKEVRQWKDDVVKKITQGLGQLVKTRKIDYIQGYAKFIDSNNIEVNTTKGEKEKISFKNLIIATGSIPTSLPGISTYNKKVMNSSESLDLKEIPGKLLVIGGGYIGLEMATIYHEFGSTVSVAELTGDFLPGIDRDLIREYKKETHDLFDEIFLNTKVKSLEEKNDLVHVSLNNEEKGDFIKKYNKVLVAIGNSPNTQKLQLENTSVKMNQEGFIKVNHKQQTDDQHIYAIGDVTGSPLLAHKASYEGKLAAEIIAGKKSANDARTIPSVVYAEPDIAICGLSEQEAKEKNINYKTVKFPWSASGRAKAMNTKSGFTKLIIDPNNERLLGAGIVGKNAGDMISELALGIEMAATAEDVAFTVHPHPTLAETIMEAAEMFYGHAGHYFTKK